LEPGTGLAVVRALADETEIMLRKVAGSEAVIERIDLSYYTVFRVQKLPGSLPDEAETYYFNGHSLLSKKYDAGKGLEFVQD
jgi:hypothetical protein